MKKVACQDDRNARYRQRLREAGAREVLFHLPEATLAMIDELKEGQGLPSRSQALMHLIEQGRKATQQVA
jgi:hypothetical protein